MTSLTKQTLPKLAKKIKIIRLNRLLIKKANKYYNKKKYIEALEYYSLVQDNENITHNIAHCYFETKQYNLAIKYFLKITQDKNIFGYLAESYYNINNFEHAEEYFLMAIENGYTNINILGNLYIKQKKYDLAKIYLTSNEDILKLGIILFYEQKFESAEEIFKLIDCGESNHYLGVLYSEHIKINMDNAIKYFSKSFEQNFNPAGIKLGDFYYEQKKYIMAEKYYLKLFSLGYDVETLAKKMAQLYFDQKIYKKALFFNEMAVIKYTDSILGIGLCHYFLNNLDKATEMLLKALDKKFYIATKYLGLIYILENKIRDAIMYFNIGIEHNIYINNLHLGDLFRNRKDNHNAIKYYIVALDHGFDCLDKFKDVCSNDMEYYISLKKIKNNTEINNIIVKLEKMPKIFFLKRKISEVSKLSDCCICYTQGTTTIPRECCHYFCVDCFVKLNSCAICKM